MKKQDFYAGMELVLLRVPKHPLVPLIKRGYSYMACKYLEKALSEVPEIAPVVRDSVTEMQVRTQQETRDPQLITLHDRVTKAISNRAKLSNKFHTVVSDSDRAIISTQIGDLQDQIERLFQEIEYFNKNGILPDQILDDKYPVPSDNVGILKKRQSLRSSISQSEKRIRSYHAAKRDHSFIQAREEKLQHLKNHLAHVEKIAEAKGL